MKNKKSTVRKSRKKREIIGMYLFLQLAALCMTAVRATAARAEELIGTDGETQITVRYDTVPVLTGQSSPGLPAKEYEWQGQKYQLKSYQLVSVPMPEIVKYAERTVMYEGIEYAAEIPQTVEVTVEEESQGRSAAGTLSLTGTEFSNWRWIDGFTFPVTVWGYDNGSFLLGEQTVEVKEEHPFAGYEKELLELIGVDPEYYRIDSVEWSGEPQTGDDGLVYRQAAASGQMRVADAEAVYRGQVVIPEQMGTAYEAVYTLPASPQPAAAPTVAEAAEPQETFAEPEVRTGIIEVPEPLPPIEPKGVFEWLQSLRRITTVVVGAGFVLLPLIFLLLWKRRRRDSDGKRENRMRNGRLAGEA